MSDNPQSSSNTSRPVTNTNTSATTTDENFYNYLKPDHPLLSKVQETLTKQLEENLYKVNADIKEVQIKLKKNMKHREDLGVCLYGSQQQLATLQGKLEEENQSIIRESEIVNELQGKSNELEEIYSKNLNHKRKLEGKLDRVVSAIAKTHETLREIKLRKEAVSSDILITQTKAFKTEKEIGYVEQRKNLLDFEIARLLEDIHRKTDAIDLIKLQKESQDVETDRAIDAITTVNRDINLIKSDITEIRQNIRSSSREIEKRDDAIVSVNRDTSEVIQNIKSIKNEQTQIRKKYEIERKNNDRICNELVRNEKRLELAISAREKTEKKRDELVEKVENLDGNFELLDIENNRLEKMIKLDLNEIEKLNIKNKKLTDKYNIKLEELASVKEQKMSSLLDRQMVKDYIKKIIQQIHLITNKIISTENEAAQCKLNIFDKLASIDEKKSQLKILEDKCVDTEQAIKKNELAIKNKARSIEKKQLYIDKLNREYEAKINEFFAESGGKPSADDIENVGPLENEIKLLNAQIAENAKQIGHLQNEWMNHQSVYLKQKETAENLIENTTTNTAKYEVTVAKKHRLDQDLQNTKNHIKSLERELSDIRSKMEKFNELYTRIGKEITTSESADRATLYRQKNKYIDLVKKEEEINKKCSSLEEEIDGIRADILKTEKDIVLVDKKITIETELCGNSVAIEDLSSMRREIRNMTGRNNKILKKQKDVARQLEKAVSKREIIRIKNSNALSKNPIGANVDPYHVKLARDNLEKSLVRNIKRNDNLRFEYSEKSHEINSIQEEIDKNRIDIVDGNREYCESVLLLSNLLLDKYKLKNLCYFGQKSQNLSEMEKNENSRKLLLLRDKVGDLYSSFDIPKELKDGLDRVLSWAIN